MARNKEKELSNSIGNDRKLKTVLIARFSALGDVAMSIPVVYSVCQCYPDVKFVMVTRKTMTGIFVNAPSNLEVVGVDVKTDYVGVKGMRRLVDELHRKYHFEAFVDLHDVLRTKLMRAFSRLKGVKVSRIHKGRSHKRALTRRNGKVMLPLLTSRQRYREAFFQMGLPIDMVFRGLYGDKGKGDPQAFANFAGVKPASEKWVGVAPFAAHPGKVYPVEKMRQVISNLAAQGNVRIFIFGAGGCEKEVADAWEREFAPHVTSLAGKKAGFPAELSLLSHLDVMLTMDSANMHLASLTGVRTVSVWGATHSYCGFKGWHQREADMVQLPISCRPCSVFGEKKCYRGDMLCMNAIHPEWISNKILEILS